MCDPVSLGVSSLIVGIGSAAASAVGQASTASANQKTANKKYNSIATAATENYLANLTQLGIRGDQEDAAATQTGRELQKQAAVATGSVKTGAAAAGVSGNTVDALLAEFAGIEGENMAAIQRNQAWARMARQDQARSLRSGTQQQISSAAPTQYTGPSPFAFALDLAKVGLDSASTYYNRKPPK